jgi:signal peptidase
MAAHPSCARTVCVAASLLALAPLLPAGVAAEDPPLFQSHAITDPGTFTGHIEGPAVDAQGNLYVVNLHKDGTIGRLAAGATKFETFATLPDGSIGNGIRFDRDGRMFIADFKKHNVFVIERGQTSAKVYFHSTLFHQPNDLAIAADGTLYVSDPVFPPHPSGQIWRITRNADGTGHGETMASDRTLGTTNGIDLSPDGATLYVSESNSFELWAYRLDGNRLRDPRRVFSFGHKDVDGLRTDVDGRIFVARPEARQIAIVRPDGTLVQTVTTLGSSPTNLTFGGPDGKTVFVTQADKHFVESFRTDRPGREPCLQAPNMC